MQSIERWTKCLALCALACVVMCTTSCGTLKAVQSPGAPGDASVVRRLVAAVFTRAALSDLVFEGSAGQSVDLVAELAAARSPELGQALQLAIAARLIEPTGPRLLSVTLKGETAPRVLVCRLAVAADCAAVPINSGVRAYVHPLGWGGATLWVVDRISQL